MLAFWRMYRADFSYKKHCYERGKGNNSKSGRNVILWEDPTYIEKKKKHTMGITGLTLCNTRWFD